eukprot:1808288-Rhodomonas_salina.1
MLHERHGVLASRTAHFATAVAEISGGNKYAQRDGGTEGRRDGGTAVSYTHLTLPTICSV